MKKTSLSNILISQKGGNPQWRERNFSLTSLTVIHILFGYIERHEMNFEFIRKPKANAGEEKTGAVSHDETYGS